MEVSPPRQAAGYNGNCPDSPIWHRRQKSYENLSTPSRANNKFGSYHGLPAAERGLQDGGRSTVEREDTQCGFLCWKPRWLQGCANMKSFIAFMSLLYLCNSTLYVYRLGVVTTIEKRFGLSSSQSGLTMSSFEISHLSSVMLISFFCKASHRPRLLAMGGFLTFVAGVIFSLPHFLYGSGISQELKQAAGAVVSGSAGNVNSSILADAGLASLCAASHTNSSSSTCDVGGEEAGSESGAFALFMVSSLVLGVSLVPINTLGLAYIDDNVPKEQAPLYLGVVLSMNQGGSITGFLLAAVFTSIFIDLGDPGIGPGDAGWLGAWWLGALILGVFAILPSIFMLFFPYEMPEKPKPTAEEEEAEEEKPSFNIFVGLKQLFTNPVFILLVIAACMDMHLVAGFLTFLPKYLEVQFNLGAYMANILAALLSGVTGMLGSFLGGAISSRLKTMTNTCLFLIVNSLVSTGALVLLAFMSCGDVDLRGPPQLGSGSLTCVSGCECGLAAIEPVCGSDGSSYVSACFAGCQQMTSQNGLLNLTSCGCDGTGYAVPGLCPSNCSLLIPYAVILVLIMLIASLNPTPAIALFLRNVSEDLKSLSLGIFNSGISLLTYIPGPTIFGIIIDGACKLWQNVCGAPGACLWYDIAKYRIIIHGLTAGLRAVGILVYIVLWFLLRRRQREEDSKKQLQENMSMNTYTKPNA